MSLSPYETHASSQNSLSSSHSHELLMIRPERDTETHTMFPTVAAGCLHGHAYEHTPVRVCVVCVCMTKQVGWIPSVISCVNCRREPIKKKMMTVKQPLALLSSWQQPQWPTTISSVPGMRAICFLLHITTSHMCDAIISSVCWRNARVYNEPCSLHRHIAKLLHRVHLYNIQLCISPQFNTNNNQTDQLGKWVQYSLGAILNTWKELIQASHF